QLLGGLWLFWQLSRNNDSRLRVDFAGTNLNVVSLDLFVRGSGHDTPTTDLKLRAMPGTLDGATNQHAIRERSAFVRAVVAERYHSITAPGDYHTFVVNFGEHYLSITQFALIANWTLPAIDGALLEFASAGIASVHTDLIAVGEGSTQPAGNAKRQDGDGADGEFDSIRRISRASAA